MKPRHSSITALLIFLVLGSNGCGLTGEKNDDGGGISLPSPVYPQAYAEPSVSPDGSKLLFVRNKITRIDGLGGFTVDPDSSGIWVAESDGNNMKLLIQSQNVGTPGFSPDMEWILFEGGAQIYKVPFAGDSVNMDSLVQLTSEGRNFFPDWSPDGQWIVYDNTTCGSSTEPIPDNSCGILIFDENGSNKELLVRGRMPNWSYVIDKFIYMGHKNEIYRFNLITKSHERLTFLNTSNSNPIDNRHPKYSPDDQAIAFQSDAEIWTIDTLGGSLIQLTTDGGVEPIWTPDRQIVYVKYWPHTYEKNNGTIWVMNADGSSKRQLTFNYGLELQ